jgi:hypothetical protein
LEISEADRILSNTDVLIIISLFQLCLTEPETDHKKHKQSLEYVMFCASCAFPFVLFVVALLLLGKAGYLDNPY